MQGLSYSINDELSIATFKIAYTRCKSGKEDKHFLTNNDSFEGGIICFFKKIKDFLTRNECLRSFLVPSV